MTFGKVWIEGRVVADFSPIRLEETHTEYRWRIAWSLINNPLAITPDGIVYIGGGLIS